jgi:hypothetical protein
MPWADRLLAAGSFFALFGGYLFSKGPAANAQQLAFRIGVVGVGVALFVAGLILKATGGANRD